MKVKKMMREKYLLKSCSRNQKGKKGRIGQWPKHLADDLVDIILDNDKYKEKLLLTNGQYYDKVVKELKERCSERGEESPCNVAQTRQKFKRCIIICRDAVMNVKDHLY